MRRGRPAHQVDPDESHAARLGAEIRARRGEQALTLAQLASRIGFSQQHLSEVERGRAPASSSFVSAVDHVLAANGELLELLPAAMWERALDRDTRTALRLAEADDVKRREFLSLGLAAAIPLEAARERLGPDVEEWERTAYSYLHEAGTVPGGDLLPALAADLKELRDLLDGPLTARQRQRLAGVAAQLSALAAGAIDRPQVARRWWRRARSAATTSGDSHVLAFVLSDQAVSGLYGGYTAGQVVAIADEALAVTNAPCAGRVGALAARAQALAVLDRKREAREALAATATAFERLPRDVTQRARVAAGLA